VSAALGVELLPGAYIRTSSSLLCVVNMLTDLRVELDDRGHQILVEQPDHDVYLLEDCGQDGKTLWHDEEFVHDCVFVRGPE
jgi:hypothetical protein